MKTIEKPSKNTIDLGFPCKFVVHLILSVMVTTQAVVFFQRDIEHVSRTNQHFVPLGALRHPKAGRNRSKPWEHQ